MISRNKLILINQLCGILKSLSDAKENYNIELTEYSCKIYIKGILWHNQLESMSDFCKKKKVNWQMESVENSDWKLMIKLWR